MRVLIINRNVGNGSVGKIVESLYRGVVKRGDECKIAYGIFCNSSVPSKDLYRISNRFDFYFHVLMSRITDRTAFFSKKRTIKLLKFIEDYKPDVVHLHGCYGYYLNIKVLFDYLARHNEIKVVNTLHSCWDFTGHCCYFTKVKCQKWKTHCKKCPEKKKYPSSLLFDSSFRNYEDKKRLFSSIKNIIYVSPCKWMLNLVKESYLKDSESIVIYNGIDLNSFKEVEKNDLILSKYGIDVTKKIVLGVASVWDDRKGMDDFIKLARIINDEYQIVLVGVNNKQIKKLPRNIITISKTNDKKELALLYSVATVLFNPTREDNYPTVNLESIACGTPVITYKTGGSLESIEKTKAGSAINECDFDALLEFVDYYSKKPFVPSKDVFFFLSEERMVNEYCLLYKKDIL